MTEVERAEVILNDAEKRVQDARADLRDARIAEVAGGKVPVAGGFREFFHPNWGKVSQ